MSGLDTDFEHLRERHQQLRDQYNQLEGVRKDYENKVKDTRKDLEDLGQELDVGQKVSEVLDDLAEGAYAALLRNVAELLSSALQDVLGQKLVVTTQVDYAYEATTVTFCIQRDGQEEDLLRGQGGAVANIVSTGLRVLALATLPADRHRRFLVLDEQDCWLQPEIVSRLVQIVHSAAKRLGFQVLMISHHDLEHFERYADRVYELTPIPEGVQLCERRPTRS